MVNNVETLANVPLIVLGGGAAFASIGTEGSTGPKLFCLSGHVARPGVYEVEFGATLRDLIELAGGVPGGRAIKTILLGGAAGVFVGPEALDTPLTFEATRAIGATLGSGVVMVFDETADLVGHAPPDRPVLPRRVVRPVRAVPGRQRPPGGAAGPPGRRLAGPATGRGAGAPARDRPGDARRLDLRPRARPPRRRSSPRCASRGWWRCERPIDPPRTGHRHTRPAAGRPAAHRHPAHAAGPTEPAAGAAADRRPAAHRADHRRRRP